MLREFAIILVSVACVFYITLGFLAPPIGWVNGLAYPGAIGYLNGYAFPVALTNGVIALGIFAGLMIYSGFRVKDLYIIKPKYALFFLAILLATTLSATTFFCWIWNQPFSI
jgi:hypothetical protein